jgi:Protein of unknown function (DUF2934)
VPMQTHRVGARSSTSSDRPNQVAPPDQSLDDLTTNTTDAAPETPAPDILDTNLEAQTISADTDIDAETDREQAIARRAYALAQAREFASGGELDDWLQAEREFEAEAGRGARPE